MKSDIAKETTVTAEEVALYFEKHRGRYDRSAADSLGADEYERLKWDALNAKRVIAIREFVADLEEFIAPLVEPGRVNALSQTLIKLTAPGVPDFYQGAELWNLDLVDPDNRRTVDFGLRRRLLAETEKLSVEEIMARMDEGLPKLWLIHRALGLRRLHPEIFTSGDYQPLIAYGEKAGHVVAFSRHQQLVTVAPRLVLTLGEDWGNTWLELVRGSWRNELTGDRLEGGKVSIQELLERFPIALLWRET